MKSLALFNPKGGVGKTTLTFNLGHLLARRGLTTVVLDLDPQCDLSSWFLSAETLASLWEETGSAPQTVLHFVASLRRSQDWPDPDLRPVADDLWLLPGHLGLSRFEPILAAEAWASPGGPDGERILSVLSAFASLPGKAAAAVGADIVLLDLGSSLGALNRAALLACDAVLVPLAPDLFAQQSLKSMGPTLRDWRRGSESLRGQLRAGPEVSLPAHAFEPIGYLVQEASTQVGLATDVLRWGREIPAAFHEHVLADRLSWSGDFSQDPACLAVLRHWASLIPIAQTSRKPLFDLKQADGIGGGQLQAVAKCRKEFEQLVDSTLRRLGSPAQAGAPGLAGPP